MFSVRNDSDSLLGGKNKEVGTHLTYGAIKCQNNVNIDQEMRADLILILPISLVI